ncbi:MAG: hypothetical protein LKE40_09320 [Spirochaetia bacterium]|jgi:hypothetical protein|nr:hypothetical protein [Spirochaetia bacterium]
MEHKSNSEKPEDSYIRLLGKLDKSPSGCEATLQISYRHSDGIDFEIEKIGFAQPPEKAVQEAVAAGKEIPLPEHNMEIPAGTYIFEQIPWLPNKESFESSLLSFSCAPGFPNQGFFFVRLLKENSLEVIMQLLGPLS